VSPQRIVGDLLNAEISEKQLRSIKCQLTIAKLPLTENQPKKRRAAQFQAWGASLRLPLVAQSSPISSRRLRPQ
jgi:hypothetical protein